MLLTHRFDVFGRARQLGWEARFGCYESMLQSLAPEVAADWRIRVPKERSLSRHLINLAATWLPEDGQLMLAGQDKEGIRTAEKDARKRLGGEPRTVRHKALRLSCLGRGIAGPALADDGPGVLRPVASCHDRPVLSGPGIFAWQHLDAGSQLLQSALEQHLPVHAPAQMLDMGCGHGHLSLVMAHHFPDVHLTAFDTNAYAIMATEANLAAWGHLNYRVCAMDCGRELEGPFDLVLCNPPFHQGFGMDMGLGQTFLDTAARVLSARGEAWFVTNRFVNLGQKAQACFKTVNRVAENAHFEVHRLADTHSKVKNC
jgi:16S rRNA (guanine1207-N2)-methyltransferase